VLPVSTTMSTAVLIWPRLIGAVKYVASLEAVKATQVLAAEVDRSTSVPAAYCRDCSPAAEPIMARRAIGICNDMM